MTLSSSTNSQGSLLIFSDDWGRHPSSCQHLTRHWLSRYPVTWVNTIGTRAPRFDLATARRVAEKLMHWARRNPKTQAAEHAGFHENLATRENQPRVINPRMWPWFSQPSDRRINQWLLTRQLSAVLKEMPRPITAITTLPITADLAGTIDVDRWVYYCVDDFSQWPGLDGKTLRTMDRDMIRKADSILAVSETLQRTIAAEGRTSELLTHGVDTEFWRASAPQNAETQRFLAMLPPEEPLVVFWGVIDPRMNLSTITALSKQLKTGRIVLIGPQQNPYPELSLFPNLKLLPAMPFHVLPQIAARSGALIMPYADLPVTRAMQPLKLKEYLATGRPVIVNQLPSTEPWADCLDSACNPEQFASLVLLRLRTGLPASQKLGRERLEHESWGAKARSFEQHFSGFINNKAADQSSRLSVSEAFSG